MKHLVVLTGAGISAESGISKACNENKTEVIEIGSQEIHVGDKAADGRSKENPL